MFYKKLTFIYILQNSQEKTSVGVTFWKLKLTLKFKKKLNQIETEISFNNLPILVYSFFINFEKKVN